MKRYLLALILLIAFLSLCGCGNNSALPADDESQAVELIYYSVGDPPKDLDKVMAKLNEYTKKKLNCTINLKILDYGSYDTKMKTALLSGDPMDLVFTCGWALDYRSNSVRGSFLPLDELLNEHGQDMKKAINPLLFEGSKINGINYGIPAQGSYGWQSGYYFDKNLVDKYNFDYSKVKSVTDLLPLFKQLKTDNPSVVPIGNTFFLVGLDKFDYITDAGTPGAVRMDDKTCTVINQFEDKEFLDMLKRTRSLFVDKLTYQDVKSQTSSTDKDFRAGKLACFVHRCPPFSAEGASRTYGFPVFTVPIFNKPVVTTGCISGSFVAIATHSKNPVRAMKFLNLFNTDPYLHNLLCFGIENLHYTKLPSGQIHITPEGIERYTMATWTLGNMFLEYVPDTEPADKWEVTRKFNADSVISPLFGFGYDPEPIQAELSSLSNVGGQYSEQLLNGACDIDATAAEYTKKAKAAGMDKMFAELQKQIDKWKSMKK